MNSKAHFSNATSLDEINRDDDSVIHESKPTADEKLLLNASVYCDGNPVTPSDVLPVVVVKVESSVNDVDITNCERISQGPFIEAKLKLEPLDLDGNCPRMSGKIPDDSCLEEIKPNIQIKSDLGVSGINNSNFHGIQTITNTDGDKESCEEDKSLHCMRDEKITIDECHLEKEEAAESKL